ncbi:hypothetical protein H6G97_03530 [Nostoc flagelliforme FACHB-838]|uniref:Uncharacterized protein n=1 Tax=Nostoc flagelliforme FACHB-838 TaxID=2692904 RepID=A0ABR8DGM0_9NOSO|nr:hypothetical protein [Nostoc flagelliforme]MBD2528682.1 hypothetical protein [Nostoc flagelliforme FACHB-838]
MLIVNDNPTSDRPVVESVNLPSAPAKPQISDTSAIQQSQANLTQALEQFVKTID